MNRKFSPGTEFKQAINIYERKDWAWSLFGLMLFLIHFGLTFFEEHVNDAVLLTEDMIDLSWSRILIWAGTVMAFIGLKKGFDTQRETKKIKETFGKSYIVLEEAFLHVFLYEESGLHVYEIPYEDIQCVSTGTIDVTMYDYTTLRISTAARTYRLSVDNSHEAKYFIEKKRNDISIAVSK